MGKFGGLSGKNIHYPHRQFALHIGNYLVGIQSKLYPQCALLTSGCRMTPCLHCAPHNAVLSLSPCCQFPHSHPTSLIFKHETHSSLLTAFPFSGLKVSPLYTNLRHHPGQFSRYFLGSANGKVYFLIHRTNVRLW